jgi:hypothetical protein
VPTAGDKATPFQSLDYALAQICAQYNLNDPTAVGVLYGDITVALKAGEDYVLNTSYNLYGNLQFTFWGDPQYGDFDGPLIAGVVKPSHMQDLLRPQIKPQINPATSNGIHHFLAVDNPNLSTLYLNGVKVALPPRAAVENSDYCDFFTVFYGQTGRLRLEGAIINKPDATSSYGLMGMHARSHDSILECYASQFWVAGIPVVPGGDPTVLPTRKWFIKFYPDLEPGDQTGGHLLNGPAANATMTLLWTESASVQVQPGKFTLGTYPVLNDAAMGIANYFFNLTRDNQARPLNVRCAYLF